MVDCGNDTSLQIHGLLATDYVLTRGESPDHFLESSAAYLERLSDMVASKVPEWDEAWQNYLATLATNDPRQDRLWRQADGPLTDLASDDPVREFPTQCLSASEEGVFRGGGRRHQGITGLICAIQCSCSCLSG